MKKIKNIAFMAHVDAGKTTLTEQILFKTGIIRNLGSVDDGTARTDDLAIERKRGISIRSTVTSFSLNDTMVNLIDTPGHLDFYSQVDRAFMAADAVIVLVAAPDGIQSGTESIISMSIENNIPIVFFVNKCDVASADNAIEQIKGIVANSFDYPIERYETAAMYDDEIMREYFDGQPENPDTINKLLTEKIKSCSVVPILHGSAHTGEGIDELLNFIQNILPQSDILSDNTHESNPETASNHNLTFDSLPVAGVVFSVIHDKNYGRGAYVRMFAGELSVRDTVNIKNSEYKISMLHLQIDGHWRDVKTIISGEIALVFGLTDCKTGDIFGNIKFVPARAAKGLTVKGLLTALITPKSQTDNVALKAALDMMMAEDPALGFVWDPVHSNMHINVMGMIQIETLSALIEERFLIGTTIGQPSVIYKETLAKPSIGFDAYTMPKPSWAVLKFELTPAKRGSGISYRCTAAPNRIPYRYRGQVETSIGPSLEQGLYGWEVTDMDINLVDGEDHPVHTHPLDFTIATPLALMDGLRNGGTILLEPILDVKLSFDSKHLGRIMSDIIKMRGQVEAPSYHQDNVTLIAKIPLATSLYYSVNFASITSGQGVMISKLYGYSECPLELGETCPRRGVNPLDRSKYILSARHALSGNIFNH